MDARRFPRGLRCPLGKSRRLRGPGAQHRARRWGVLSLRQVSLHRQRKGARAVTARKPLILPLLLLATHKSKSSSLRSPPHPPSGHLLPQAGEGLEPHRARRRGVCSLRRVSLHKQRKVARAVTARKPLTLMSAKERRVKTRPTGLLPATRKSKG